MFFKRAFITSCICMLTLTGCNQTEDTPESQATTIDLSNTTQVVGKVASVVGNEINLQLGELNIRSASEVIVPENTTGEAVPVDGVAGDRTQMQGGTDGTAQSNKGNTAATTDGAVPVDGVAGDRTQMQGGTDGTAQSNKGNTAATTDGAVPVDGVAGDRTQMQGGTTTNTNTQTQAASSGTTNNAQAQAQSGERTQGDRTQMQSGDRTQTQGSTGPGGTSGGSAPSGSAGMASSIDYTDYITLSDQNMTFNIGVGTPVYLYGNEFAFTSIAKDQFLSLYYDENGILIAVSILG